MPRPFVPVTSFKDTSSEEAQHKSLCVLIHVGNVKLISEMTKYTDQIPLDIEYDVYAAFNQKDPTNYIDEMKNHYQVHRPNVGFYPIHIENKGMDLNGWFAGMDAILNKKCTNTTYKYTFKIHTKTNDYLRGILILPFLTDNRFSKLIQYLEDHSDVAMIVAGKSDANHNMHMNGELIHEYEKRFGVTCPPNTPIALGSVFLSRMDFWTTLFSKVSPVSIMEEMPVGHVMDNLKGQRPHAWESLFTRLVAARGFKTMAIYELDT